MERKLYRNEYDKNIAGVCSGLAEYLKIDVALVRVAFLLLAIFKGGGLLAYIILWIVLPVKHAQAIDVDYVVDQAGPPRPSHTNPLPRSSENGTTIAGFILIGIGAYFLFDQFDILPDWFNAFQFWPLIIIVVGLAIIFGPRKKHAPWQHTQTWEKRQPENPHTEDHPNDQNTPPTL